MGSQAHGKSDPTCPLESRLRPMNPTQGPAWVLGAVAWAVSGAGRGCHSISLMKRVVWPFPGLLFPGEWRLAGSWFLLHRWVSPVERGTQNSPEV